jgi:hypothetical protein
MDPFVGSFQFFNARTGKLTASKMSVARKFLAKGGESVERANYKKSLVAERMTDIVTQNYVNESMKFGLENEDDAKAAYTRATGRVIHPCGFFDHFDIDNFGATPDGLVDPDGLIETKVPETTTHIAWMAAGVVPEQHKDQMIAQCACTGRSWVDFVSYDPRIKDPKRQLFIRRFTPTAEEIAAVEDAARQFLAEVDALFDAVNASEAA